MKPTVYFSKTVSPEMALTLFCALEKTLPSKVAAKVHSGEEGNQNFLRPDFWKPVIEKTGAVITECNTAYNGARNETKKHLELLERHGWTRQFAVDLLDAEGPDWKLSIPDGLVLHENYVGKHLQEYSSLLVLSHFKGHPAGGYGGALKQLSIGCASSMGKCHIHSGGLFDDPQVVWGHMASPDVFCESMADAASSVLHLFGENCAFINVMANLSVDCDCCAVAEDPCMQDIGILASLDPVALDQACLDLIYASDDPGKAHFIKRVESLHGVHTIEAAEKLGIGQREYTLCSVD